MWRPIRNAPKAGPKILVATSMGCYQHAVITEGVLSVALSMRGAQVELLLCGRALPCCQMTKLLNVEPAELLGNDETPRCESCVVKGDNEYVGLGLPLHTMLENLDERDKVRAAALAQEPDLADVPDLMYEGMAVGEHAYAGALRYFGRGDIAAEPDAEPIVRRYLRAAYLCLFATRNLLRKNDYDIVVFHHGIYVPQGVIGEVCRAEGVKVVNWNPSYRKNTFVFSHDDTYHHTMITEPVSIWQSLDFTPDLETKTMDYLKSRWHGDRDWIWFHESPEFSLERVEKEIGLDFSRPVIGALTSVMWDAQLHYKSNAFRNQIEWMRETIAYFSKRPDLQLAIRVHPAEVNGLVPSRQKMVDVINEMFSEIPDNIHVIPPESNISTYAVMQACDSVIIYNTKMGIELASMGIPVIVAGEAWIRNKGFSRDAGNLEEYRSILDTLPTGKKLDEEALTLAKKYAYHFFFRRMIDVPIITSFKKFKFALDLDSVEELMPGHHQGLDIICQGILEGSPFCQNPPV